MWRHNNNNTHIQSYSNEPGRQRVIPAAVLFLGWVCDPVQAAADHNSNQRDPATDSHHPSNSWAVCLGETENWYMCACTPICVHVCVCARPHLCRIITIFHFGCVYMGISVDGCIHMSVCVCVSGWDYGRHIAKSILVGWKRFDSDDIRAFNSYLSFFFWIVLYCIQLYFVPAWQKHSQLISVDEMSVGNTK